MHFSTKSYLKSTRNHTVKHTLNQNEDHGFLPIYNEVMN
jgi:hypothetical protein